MSASYIFLSLTTLYFMVVSTYGYEECYYEDDINDEVQCITESSYAYVICKPLSKVTGNKSDEGLVWLPWRTITKCKYPKSKCRCFVHSFWNWYDQGCECYNPSPIPKFPPIGVIRWTGTYEDEHWDVGEKEYKYRGEAHKLGNGNYMKKEFSTNGNLTKFEILVAEGRRYTKYSGNTNNKSCNIETRQAEKTLESIWERFFSKDKSKISIHSSYEGDGPSEVIQVWKLDEIHGDWDDLYTWTVKFDKVTHTVVPIGYKYRFRDHTDFEDAYENYDYTFSKLEDGDESFQLSDYCENI